MNFQNSQKRPCGLVIHIIFEDLELTEILLKKRAYRNKIVDLKMKIHMQTYQKD